MTVTTTKTSLDRLMPAGGVQNKGYMIGFVLAGTKNLQNDIWAINNAKTLVGGVVTTDADGVRDAVTISGLNVTLTGATGSAGSGLFIYT